MSAYAPQSSANAWGTDRVEQLLSVAGMTLCIELVFFKFLPDIATAALQNRISTLADFAAFERYYLSAGSVHYARFLDNHIVYYLAKLFASVSHNTDPRLHPLRIAAGVVTPIYAYLGALPVLRDAEHYSWRSFFALYALTILMGLYSFYPGDVSSLACLSLSLFFLLREQLAAALLCMLVTGLFRESAFHAVWFVAVWAVCAPTSIGTRAIGRRMMWLGIFALAFAVEYLGIRHFFPGSLTSVGGLNIDPGTVFLGAGTLSLTALCSVGLAALFPIACWWRARNIADRDWRRRFFRLNCYAFPLWIVFYRMMNGNLAEFRMFLPVVLPYIYGVAYAVNRREAAQ